MASWRGITFLWSFASVFFLGAGILMMRASHYGIGTAFVAIGVVDVVVAVICYRRMKADTPS